MKNRNILKMILLTIVTFGIYYLYWLVSTTREMRVKGADIPNAILIIIPILNIWWMWKYSKGVEHVTNDKLSAILTFILMYAVGFIGIYIVQDSFNDVSAQSGPASPASASTGGQAQAPGGHQVDPAMPTATATATGAGVGVAASQVDNAQAAPSSPTEPPKDTTPTPEPTPKPEETSQPEEPIQEPDTSSESDDSLEQPASETPSPNNQETTPEDDKNTGADTTPPVDPGQSMGPSL